jgi:hypothetical protein
MRTIFYLIAFIFTVSAASGQTTMIELEAYEQVDSLHYHVIVHVSDAPDSSYVLYDIYNAGGVEFIEAGDTIFNMRIEETVRVYYFGDNEGTLALDQLEPAAMRFHVSAYTAPGTPLSLDGIIEFTFDQWDVLPMCDMHATNHAGTVFAIETTDSLTYTVSGFGRGDVNFYLGACSYDIYNDNFSFYVGDPEFTIGNQTLGVTMTATDVTEDCNGSATLYPIGAVGPVSYLWSDNSVPDTSSWDQLCPGAYEVLFTDSLMNTGSAWFIMVEEDNVFTVNNSSTGSAMQDTVMVIFSDCDFDYTTAIDSVSYIEQVDTVSYPQHYVHFWLSVFNGNDTTLLEAGFFTPDYHNVLLSAYIYCQSATKSVFKGKKVVVDTQEALALSVPGKEQKMIRMYPNPTSNKLSLAGIYTGKVIDQLGKVVLTFTGSEVSLEALNAGIYSLQVEGSSAVYRIVKQ